jgi:hypothetical protein
MAMVEYAEKELKRAGWFDKDADYAGLVGPAVIEMMKQFAQEGHSGYSAHLVLHIFERLARYRPLTPLDNPMTASEYVDHTEISGGQLTYQSTRLSSLFSEDGGQRWYDLDLKLPKWKRWIGIRRAYVKFPYMPA